MYNEKVKPKDLRHVEGGTLEGGFAEDKESSSSVRWSRVGVVPVAVSFHHWQISIHLIHCHHGHLKCRQTEIKNTQLHLVANCCITELNY